MAASSANKKIQYAMVIDLNRCVGCNACTVSCKQQWPDKVPPGEFRSKIAEIETGIYPDVAKVFRRTACMHCTDAPCVVACPTDPKASYKTPEGVTRVNADLCIQCEACVHECPYHVRYLNWDNQINDKADSCDFCYERIMSGEMPACTVNCVGQVFTFGNMNDPKSEVAQKIKLAKPLQPELGTKPNVFYIPQGDREWQTL